MYEELIKSLRACVDGDKCEDCIERENLEVKFCWVNLLAEAADAIEELCKEVDALKHDIERYIQINADLLSESKWIRAEERLPDDDTHVLYLSES